MTFNPTNKLCGHRAFTLVEVMISVALVLVLIIGVNQVFKITTDTVSAGMVMSGNVRDSRAAQAVIFNDLQNAVTQTPPAFIIASSRVSAFRNPNDLAADRDYAGAEPQIRTLDFDDDNTEGEATVVGERVSPATYNFRSHRTDRLAFFSRDVHRRQTANDGSFYSPISSTEAWVWYGHLKLPNNAGVYKGPGLETPATNQNNFVASSFALGRMAMLLKDPAPTATPPGIPAGVAHYPRDSVFPATTTNKLGPLSYETVSTGTPSHAIFSSRYDLAGISIAQFLEDVRTEILASGSVTWWQRLLYSGPYSAIAAPLPNTRDFRYEADRLFAKPLDSAKAARLAPILLSGCSQFIVEFAGDYITQNNDPAAAAYGNRTSDAPDGIIDFVVDQQTGTTTPTPAGVRWYGMPRDTAGSPTGGPDGIIGIPTAPRLPVDVVPVRDVRSAAVPPAFERNANEEIPAAADYAFVDPGGTPAMLPEARYTCVWGPDVPPPVPGFADPNGLPQMLRITFVLDDPNGRIGEGQTYEFVIDLP